MGQIVSVPVLAELQGEIRRHPKTNKTFLVTAITSRSSSAGFSMRLPSHELMRGHPFP